MVSDRVGDFIIRLQNAAMAGKRDVIVPYSLHLAAIAKKLKDLGFVSEVETKATVGDEIKKELVVSLTYEGSVARIRGVKRISKPGRRMYVSSAAAHRVKGGTGARVLSTPRGIVSDTEARKEKIGGENLFEIW